MSNKKSTSAFWERRKLEADIYLREVFRRPRTIKDTLALIVTPFFIIGALYFVIAMPSWPIRHNAANMPPKTVQTTVEEVSWIRPRPRDGFGMSYFATFEVEGVRVEWGVPTSVKRGDKIAVTYAIDTDGRVLIIKVTAPHRNAGCLRTRTVIRPYAFNRLTSETLRNH
jgi:hypothetical protein